MKKLCVLVLVLVLCIGCATTKEPEHQYRDPKYIYEANSIVFGPIVHNWPESEQEYFRRAEAKYNAK